MRESAIHAAVQARLHRAPGLLHPEDHPGDHAHRDQRERAADDLLRLGGESVRAEGEDGADAEREGDGETDADPHAAQNVCAAESADVGDQDAYDEGGFEAFAKADEERCEHGIRFCRRIDKGCLT